MYFFEKFLTGNFSVDGVRSLVVTFTAIGYMSGKVLHTPLWSAARTASCPGRIFYHGVRRYDKNKRLLVFLIGVRKNSYRL